VAEINHAIESEQRPLPLDEWSRMGDPRVRGVQKPCYTHTRTPNQLFSIVPTVQTLLCQFYQVPTLQVNALSRRSLIIIIRRKIFIYMYSIKLKLYRNTTIRPEQCESVIDRKITNKYQLYNIIL